MQVANLYDNGPISPIAKISENLALWKEGTYSPYKIQWIEGMPQSSPLVLDLVALAGATSVAAGSQTAKQTAIIALSAYPNELIHLRWEPIDDVEGILWELNDQARYSTKGVQARTGPFTSRRDPFLASTTFWILGQNRDPSFSAYNPWGIAQPTARFAFWGYRYVLTESSSADKLRFENNNLPITYIPVQGRSS